VIRLLKLCVGLAAFVGFAWFGSTVKLGPRTLFQHLRAIGQTKESQELVDGTKEAASPLVDGVRRRIAGAATPSEKPAAGKPQDDISPSDRRHLRRIIGSAEP
jgi:hypothetical protein